jgi:hypothetical protein
LLGCALYATVATGVSRAQNGAPSSSDLTLVVALDMSGSMRRSDPDFLEIHAVRSLLETARLLGPDRPLGLRLRTAVVLFGSTEQIVRTSQGESFFTLDWNTTPETLESFLARIEQSIRDSAGADRRLDWFTDFNGAVDAIESLIPNRGRQSRDGRIAGPPLVLLLTDGDFEPWPLAPDYWEGRSAAREQLLRQVADLGKLSRQGKSLFESSRSQRLNAPQRMNEQSILSLHGGGRPVLRPCLDFLEAAASEVRAPAAARLRERLDDLGRVSYAGRPWNWRVIGLHSPSFSPEDARRFDTFLRDSLGPIGNPTRSAGFSGALIASAPNELEPLLLTCLADWLELSRYRVSATRPVFHLDPTIEGAAAYGTFRVGPDWATAGPAARIAESHGLRIPPRASWKTATRERDRALVWHIPHPRAGQWRFEAGGDSGTTAGLTLIARSRLEASLDSLPARWMPGQASLAPSIVFRDRASRRTRSIAELFSAWPDSVVADVMLPGGRRQLWTFLPWPAGRPSKFRAVPSHPREPGLHRVDILIEKFRLRDSGTWIMERELAGAYEVESGMVPLPGNPIRLRNRPDGARTRPLGR